jgi:hypothetical protein
LNQTVFKFQVNAVVTQVKDCDFDEFDNAVVVTTGGSDATIYFIPKEQLNRQEGQDIETY